MTAFVTTARCSAFTYFIAAILAVLSYVAALANPPVDQLSEAKVKAMAQELVDGVESTYECVFSLDYLVTGLERKIDRYTVVVSGEGCECAEALRALQLRSIAFPFSFIELDSDEVSQ